MSDNIKVVVKVRPLISREIEEKLSHHWRVGDNALFLLEHNGKDTQCFTFDKVYDEVAKTTEVYEDIAKPIVESAVAGINGTIFAYGQTSSGKTYTMTGTAESPGIIPLSVQNLFKIIESKDDRDFLLRVSYIEIYNDAIKDLLNAKNDNIKIRENIQGIKTESTERVVSTYEEVMAAMKEGEDNRHIGATNMNERSSRSHTIFQITIESREHVEEQDEAGCVNVSQLNLVDLAGSERAGQTGATGKRFLEGTHINKSLTVLALVIMQLSEGKLHVSYRDSKLTRILQNSLGGNAKTSIICAVTPATVEETISTLQFANRAKNIKNKPEVNAVATNATMIQKLTKQLSKLQLELMNKKDLEKDNRILTEQINKLRRQIINGFTQNPREVLSNPNRRKTWCAPRRMTIDSVPLSVIDEDTPAVGPFATPMMKFNPSAIPTSSSLNKVRSELTMSRLSEESSGMTTPRPSDTKVLFDNEVIEIDSDEDVSVAELCSPVHGCYESKTPPCVLRYKVKNAEKNYKEIVELAEREKQYPPPIGELLLKLEKNTDVVRKMEDQINELNKKCEDKESEIELFKVKLTSKEKSLQDINEEKSILEASCKELHIKLTDLEVSYETLSRKAKLREEELLSLLEEQKQVQSRRNGKPLELKSIERDLNNFMDISKDISLVNSDNETDEAPLVHLHETISNDQLKQLANKDKLIEQLESEIITFKNKIAILEKSNEAVLTDVGDLKNRINDLDSTNLMLSTNNDTLKSLLKTHEDNLALANEDLKSYNNLVKELNDKLEPQSILSVEILNSLLKADEQIVTNNENTNHVIEMLKTAIESRNKEILDLKLQSENTSKETNSLKLENNSLSLSLSNLEKENKELQKCYDDIKNELQDLRDNYNALEKAKQDMSDKMNLQEIDSQNILIMELRQSINMKESNLTSTKAELENLLKELQATTLEKDSMKLELDNANLTLNNLRKDYDDIKKSLDLINDELKVTQDINNALEMKNKELLDKNNDFQEKLNNEQPQEICIGKIAKRIKSLLLDLTGLETEIVRDSNTQVIDFINNCINQIESKVKIMSEDTHTQQKLTILNEKYEKLKQKVLDVTGAEQESKKLYDKLLQQHNEVTNNFLEMTKVLERKIQENLDLKENLDRLNIVLQENENIIKMLKNNESEMLAKMENQEFLFIETDVLNKNLEQELENLRSDNESHLIVFDQTVKNKDLLIDKLNDRIIELESYLSKNQSELSQTTENTVTKINAQHELLQSILENIVNIIKTNNIEVDMDLSEGNNMYEQIPSVLHVIETHIHHIQNRNLENQGPDVKAQPQNKELEIHRLNEVNSKIMDDLKQFQTKCDIYNNKVIAIEQHNEQLTITLKECYNCIEKLTDEVKEKSALLDSLEYKAKQLKTNFMSNRASDTCDLVNPDSLMSICCNKVSEVLLCSSESTLTPSSSKSQLGRTYLETREIGCQCETLNTQLKNYEDHIEKLEKDIEFLRMANSNLIQEQKLVREEIQLLLEPSNELQKKLSTHKTHLSSLTATTYAETQLLKSQVKYLDHHHKRFYHLCQRDIPEVKKQLARLHDLLKTETMCRNNHNTSFKRYSLPTFLDCDNSQDTLKNDSTLDGEMLMLDTNVTLATSTDTLTCLNQTCLDETQALIENLGIPSHTDTSHSYMIDFSEHVSENDDKINTVMSDSPPINNVAVKANSVDLEVSKYDILLAELNETKAAKIELEERVAYLNNQLKNIETVSIKLKSLEKELSHKADKIKRIQDENDQLSTEIMDNVTELDDLKKEINNLKTENCDLTKKCTELENLLLTSHLEEKMDTSHCRRSISTENTRNTKFCTLQNELHASKEDCRKINEEVATMRNQLERSNLSISQAMDVDDSMSESNIFTFTKDFETAQSQLLKSNTLHHINDSKSGDGYSSEKLDCFNFYFEKTGADKENFSGDFKIIDVMKLLYNNVLIQHGNEVQNLTNKLQIFEDTRNAMESQITTITRKYSIACEELDNNAKSIAEVLKNTDLIIKHMDSAICDGDTNMKLVANFKDVLKLLDSQFSLKTTTLFETLIDHIALKHQKDLRTTMDQYTQLQGNMETVAAELEAVNENLMEMQMQLTKKEEEYNHLKAQKDKMQEINSALTMDIVQREQKLNDMIMQAYQKLIEHNIVVIDEFDLDNSLTHNVNKLLEKLINQTESLGHTTSEKEKILQSLSEELSKLQNENKQLNDTQNRQKQSLQDLSEKHENILLENISKTEIIDNLQQQIAEIKIEMCESNKQHSNEEIMTDMMVKLDNLRTLNECIAQEKSALADELKKSSEIIESNKLELENMTKRLSELNDSVSEKLALIEALKIECEALKQNNEEITSKLTKSQQQYDSTTHELSRLKLNIKTHEKSAEILAKMISRLQKNKVEDAEKIKERDQQIDELNNKYAQLQRDLETVQNELKLTKDSLSQLQQMKDSAEARVSELEAELTGSQKDRLSIDKVKRRRQSLIDSKRGFNDDKPNEDHNSMEAVFASRSSAKPDDMFMDVDDHGSNRSTPTRKRRDSILQPRVSETSDDKPRSRSSSVSDTRRRRQSVHDKLRSSLTLTESLQYRLRGDNANVKSADSSLSESELATLKQRLQSCQQELDFYKTRCKELDEECDMCAECLQERDEFIAKLRQEKDELKQKLSECTAAQERINLELSRSIVKPSLKDAAVNTDADWANLHSVVVDRMSYDFEVEKNKKLVKAMEELRHKNRTLKTMVAQLQQVADKKQEKTDDSMARELAETKRELDELRKKYKEMDEEYETCAEYLRERELHCNSLRKDKAALAARLLELQEDVKEITKSSRKKRQSFHDQNRDTGTSQVDASTETTEDLLINQAKDSPQYTAQDIAFYNKKIDSLAQEKSLLEQQVTYLSARAQNPSVMYVGTGSAIVQNQQITELMKENQKLKRQNSKLINLCQKRGKSNRRENNENEPIQQG